MLGAVKQEKSIHIDHVLVSILDSCSAVQTMDDYNNLLKNGISKVLPHSFSLSGIVDHWKLSLLDYAYYGFPDDYIGKLVAKSGDFRSPMLRCWKQKYLPFFVNNMQAMATIDPVWVELTQKYGINNMIVHGVVDLTGKLSSYICFANSSVGWKQTHCSIFQILIPSLHVALKRVLYNQSRQRAEDIKLTIRELEIIRLLQNGKTNKQMALLLGISDNTVRNHMRNAFDKLGVKNRAGAIAKAITDKLIHI